MKSNPKNSLSEALTSEIPDEQIAVAIREALAATQTTRSGVVEPDHKTRLQAATLALAYKHGRPVDRQEVITTTLPMSGDALLERIRKSDAMKNALRRYLGNVLDQ